MPGRQRYGEQDTPYEQDGDNGFVGINSYLEPELLEPGMIQVGQDIRLDGRLCTTRNGWDFLAGTVDVTYSAGTEQIFAAGLYSDPDDGNLNWIVAVMKDMAIIWNEDNPNGLKVNFAGGVASTTTSMVLTVVQAFSSVYILRTGQRPLVWDGDTTDDTLSGTSDSEFTELSATASGSGDRFPNAAVGTYFQERLIGIMPSDTATPTQNVTGAQTVVMSDILTPNNITPVDGNGGSEFYLNQGSADWVVGFAPYLDHQLVVFNRRSIHIISNVHATSISVRQTIEDRYGCVARRSIAQGGGYIFFLSDDGVFTLSAAQDAVTGAGLTVSKLQGATVPLSQTIQDEIDALDFSDSSISLAAGVVHDNKYYLAVNEVVFVYDMLNTMWVSKDTYPENIIDWVVMPYGTSTRLFAIAKTGWYMMNENDGLDDSGREIGNNVPTTTTPIAAKLKTRDYHAGDNVVKRFPKIQVSSNCDNGDAFTVKLNTREPDSTATVITYTASATEEKLHKSRSRQRGYACNLEIDVTAGSPAFRRVQVDALAFGGNNQRDVE